MKNKILASITALCAALGPCGRLFRYRLCTDPDGRNQRQRRNRGKTEPQPLTPEGNMTLVDDIDGDAAEDKQFIVVKAKAATIFTLSLTGQPRGKIPSTS